MMWVISNNSPKWRLWWGRWWRSLIETVMGLISRSCIERAEAIREIFDFIFKYGKIYSADNSIWMIEYVFIQLHRIITFIKWVTNIQKASKAMLRIPDSVSSNSSRYPPNSPSKIPEKMINSWSWVANPSPQTTMNAGSQNSPTTRSWRKFCSYPSTPKLSKKPIVVLIAFYN